MRKINLLVFSAFLMVAAAAVIPQLAQGEVISEMSSRTKSSISIDSSNADVVVEQKVSNTSESSIQVTQYVESNGKVLKDETTFYPTSKNAANKTIDREELKKEIKDQAKGEVEAKLEKVDDSTKEAEEEVKQELEEMKEEFDQEFAEMDRQLEEDLNKAERDSIRERIRNWWERFNKWIDERFN